MPRAPIRTAVGKGLDRDEAEGEPGRRATRGAAARLRRRAECARRAAREGREGRRGAAGARLRRPSPVAWALNRAAAARPRGARRARRRGRPAPSGPAGRGDLRAAHGSGIGARSSRSCAARVRRCGKPARRCRPRSTGESGARSWPRSPIAACAPISRPLAWLTSTPTRDSRSSREVRSRPGSFSTGRGRSTPPVPPTYSGQARPRQARSRGRPGRDSPPRPRAGARRAAGRTRGAAGDTARRGLSRDRPTGRSGRPDGGVRRVAAMRQALAALEQRSGELRSAADESRGYDHSSGGDIRLGRLRSRPIVARPSTVGALEIRAHPVALASQPGREGTPALLAAWELLGVRHGDLGYAWSMPASFPGLERSNRPGSPGRLPATGRDYRVDSGRSPRRDSSRQIL